MPGRATPALTELAQHLSHRGIDTNPKEFAAIILEIVRDKMPGRNTHGPLVDWIQQLAVDMLQEPSHLGSDLNRIYG